MISFPPVSESAFSLWPYNLGHVGRTTSGHRRDKPQQVLLECSHVSPALHVTCKLYSYCETRPCSAGFQIIAASASCPSSTIFPVHRVILMLSEGVKAYCCKLKSSWNLQTAYYLFLVILTKQTQREIIPLLSRCPVSRWIINTLSLFHYKKSSWRGPNKWEEFLPFLVG